MIAVLWRGRCDQHSVTHGKVIGGQKIMVIRFLANPLGGCLDLKTKRTKEIKIAVNSRLGGSGARDKGGGYCA